MAEEYGMDGAQNYLNQLSLEERVKFYEQPKSSTSQKPANEIQDEYIYRGKCWSTWYLWPIYIKPIF